MYEKYALFHLSYEGQNVLFVVPYVLGSKRLLRADWGWSAACRSVQWDALGKGTAGP